MRDTSRAPEAHTGNRAAARLIGGIVALMAVLAMLAGVGATTASAAPNSPHKSYVCKYVGKPGVDERLQTGQNPIFVDNHALLGYDGTTYVGQEFKDRQGRSVVIVANTEKLSPEPTVADCPSGPTTTTTTTKTTTTTSSTTTHPSTTTTHPSTTTTHPSTTTTHPSTTTTSTSTHSSGTWTTSSSHASSGGGSGAATYPLMPVNSGVNVAPAESGSGLTPVQVGLMLVALAGLWLAATGGRLRLPRLIRVGSSSDQD